jgi:hypothetical protein
VKSHKKLANWFKPAVFLVGVGLAQSVAIGQIETSITSCNEKNIKELTKPSLERAIALNAPAVVSVVVLRPRRDPFEEFEALGRL